MNNNLLKEEMYRNGFHWCKKCNQFKPFSMFYKRNDMTTGLTNECKDCIKERVKNSVNNRKEEVDEYQKQYHQKNKSKNNKYQRQYYLLNTDKIKEISKKSYNKNKDKKKIYSKKYLQSEHGRIINVMKERRRRSLKKNLLSDLTLKQWQENLLFWTDKEGNVCCAYCNKMLDKITQEHIIPLSKDGEYTQKNIIPSCFNCNSSKGNKTLEEFFLWSDFFTDELYNKVLSFLSFHNKVGENCG